MARLNGYLYRINVAESDQCACGQARETVEHFLFRCQKWTTQRTDMLQCTLGFEIGFHVLRTETTPTPNAKATAKPI